MPARKPPSSRRRGKPAVPPSARRPGSVSRVLPEGLTFGRKLGINVTEDDALFLGFTALQSLISPETARDRIRLIPAILERSVPDTEVTRRKLGRLLAGVARVAEAGSVLLSTEDYNVLAQFRAAAQDSLRSLTEPGQPLTEEDLATSAFIFWHGAMRIIRDLKVHPDPKVRRAMVTLATAGDLLDVDRKLPPAAT